MPDKILATLVSAIATLHGVPVVVERLWKAFIARLRREPHDRRQSRPKERPTLKGEDSNGLKNHSMPYMRNYWHDYSPPDAQP